ncbi:Protein Elys [Manis pentadactyla]|nr:Protein Elys [Manis pentadactyla]
MNINRACGLARPGRARRPARVPAPACRRASEAGPSGRDRADLGRPSRGTEIPDPPLEGAEEIVVGEISLGADV